MSDLLDFELDSMIHSGSGRLVALGQDDKDVAEEDEKGEVEFE